MSTSFDFAILVLAESLDFSDFIQPICLPMLKTEMMSDNFEGELAQVSRWGLEGSSQLQKLQDLRVMSQVECQNSYLDNDVTIITNEMICTLTENGKSPCSGDSGGPLMWTVPKDGRLVVIGLVAFGDGNCNNATLPTVYARVTSVLHWIDDVAGDDKCLSDTEVMEVEGVMSIIPYNLDAYTLIRFGK